jgi:hypothetical protein
MKPFAPQKPFPPLWADVGDSELRSLLHPAAAFNRPQDVLADPDLTKNEKRAILSSWASDACAVDSAPALRQPLGARQPVSFDEIADALRSLDDDDPPRPRPGGKSAWPRSNPSGLDRGGGGGLPI